MVASVMHISATYRDTSTFLQVEYMPKNCQKIVCTMMC